MIRTDLARINESLSTVENEMTDSVWTVAFSIIMIGSILGNSLVLWAVLGRNNTMLKSDGFSMFKKQERGDIRLDLVNSILSRW